MNAQEMWKQYADEEKRIADYEAWAYGDAPDELAQLTLDGIKTGTASLRIWYDLENEELPREGEYHIILDSQENAVCVIRTTKVYVVPFDEVQTDHAFREGEGDRSLAYWRRVHEAFFSKELMEAGMTFNQKMEVVCEEFEKVYP